MAELLSVADLEAAKKQDTFHSEVITGKAGGVVGGADIDYATNAVTGQVQKTLPKILDDIDWSYVGLFADGVEFTKRSDFAVDTVGIQWVYVGAYPFTATAGTVPTAPNYQVVHVGDHAFLSGLNPGNGSSHNARDISWGVYDENSDSVAGYAAAKTTLSNKRAASKAIVSFMFDDGYLSITDRVVPLFKLKGFTCGFGISATLADSSSATYDTITNLLAHQVDGFEICNHGYDPTPLITNDKGVPFARSQINGNYNKLRQYGFDVQTYIAGNSTLHADYIPITKERHASAYTVAGSSNEGVAALQSETLNPYTLFRPSAYTLGVVKVKAAIDAAIANDGWLCLYDHDPDNIYNPSLPSLTIAQWTEILDYCISTGVTVANPRDAIDLLHSSTIKSRKIDQVSIQSKGVVNVNLLRDPFYKTIKDRYSGWGKGTSTGDATFTASVRKQSLFGNDIALSVAANGTVVSGTYVFGSAAQRRPSDQFESTSNLVFSCVPYVTNNTEGFWGDFFSLQIQITQRKQSDDSLIQSVLSDVLSIDTRPRQYPVNISPKNYSDASYFEVDYVITDKLTGTARTIVIANPKLEVGDIPTPFTADAPKDVTDYDFAEATIDIAATGIISGTQINLASVDNKFFKTVGNQILFNETGFYARDLVVAGVAGGPYTNITTTVGTVKNGVAETKITENNNSGSRLRWLHSDVRFFKSGDLMHYTGTQNQGGTAVNVDTGVRSYLRITKIG
jgi:peptidoglycan/xylan/chitin deacetylase (PgdA/CDA1 family)